jgi:hypothetical protein
VQGAADAVHALEKVWFGGSDGYADPVGSSLTEGGARRHCDAVLLNQLLREVLAVHVRGRDVHPDVEGPVRDVSRYAVVRQAPEGGIPAFAIRRAHGPHDVLGATHGL